MAKKAAIFFTKLSQKQFIGYILRLLLWNLLSWSPQFKMHPGTLSSTLLLIWPTMPHLKHSTAFQSPKSHIPLNKSMVRPITAIAQSLVPTSLLVRVSTAVKRHHNQGSSYKEQYLVEAGLQVQVLDNGMFSPLSSWQEAQKHLGRHGTGGAKSSTSSTKGRWGADCLPGS